MPVEISLLASPAVESPVVRDLLSTHAEPRPAKPTWTADEAPHVARALARAGAAITQGEVLADPWRRWDCGRAPGESWASFALRSAEEAIAAVRDLGGAEHAIDFAWVTEDELALFAPPRVRRERMAALVASGGPEGAPWAPLTTRVSLAGAPAAGSVHGHAASDVQLIPEDAQFAHVNVRATGFRDLVHRRALRTLTLRGARDADIAHLAGMTGLAELHLFDAKFTSVAPLADLGSLSVLTIHTKAPLATLAPLEGAASLRWLDLRAPRVDIEQLAALRQLLSLHLLTWPAPMDSLAPLGRLGGLRYLSVAVERVRDPSLAGLTALCELQHLALEAGTFPLAEWARLSVALPGTRGLEQLPFAGRAPAVTPERCATCGGRDLVTTAARPRKTWCRACDASRIGRYVVEWEVLRSAAA